MRGNSNLLNLLSMKNTRQRSAGKSPPKNDFQPHIFLQDGIEKELVTNLNLTISNIIKLNFNTKRIIKKAKKSNVVGQETKKGRLLFKSSRHS